MENFIVWLIAGGVFFLFISLVYGNIKYAVNRVKDKNDDFFDYDYFKDNFQNIIDYWTKIIPGDLTLRNGESFNLHNFYNPKLLKYELKYIRAALFYIGEQAIEKKDKNLLNDAHMSYIRLANFLKDIPKDYKTESSYLHDLVLSHKSKVSAEDLENLIKEISEVDIKKVNASNRFLHKRELELTYEFQKVIKSKLNKLYEK